MLKPKASNRTKSLVKWGGYSFEVWQNGDKNISYSSSLFPIVDICKIRIYFIILCPFFRHVKIESTMEDNV